MAITRPLWSSMCLLVRVYTYFFARYDQHEILEKLSNRNYSVLRGVFAKQSNGTLESLHGVVHGSRGGSNGS